MKIILIFFILVEFVFADSFIQKDSFETVLYPKLHKKFFYNVMQGITSWNNLWITTQTQHDKAIVFNIFNNNGKSLYNTKIDINSHGQDLSVIQKNGKILLYSTGKKWQGISEYRLKISRKLGYSLKFAKNISLNIGKNTPTISDSGDYFVTCANKSIYIFDEESVIHQHMKYIFSFILAKKQREKRQWKQGISVKNGYIYILTGANKINDKKYLYIYDFYGKKIKSFELKTGRNFAKKEHGKWELEGLTFRKNSLYTTVMTGKDGANIHRLYKILDLF
jgi:hypothetical protein